MDKIKAIVQVGKLGKLEEASVMPAEAEIEVVPQNAYGLSKVTVSAVKLQDKSVNPAEVPQTITADEGYNGLKTVSVASAKLQAKVVEPAEETQVVTADGDNYGLELVTVKGIKLQDKSVTANNTTQIITADEEYTALKSVEVSAVKLQDKEIALSNETQEITADAGFSGINKVSVPGAYTLQDWDKFCASDSAESVLAFCCDALITLNPTSLLSFGMLNYASGTPKRILSFSRFKESFSGPQTLSYGVYKPLVATLIKLRGGYTPSLGYYSGTDSPALRELVITTAYAQFLGDNSVGSFTVFSNMKYIVLDTVDEAKQRLNKGLVRCTEIDGLINSKSPHFQSGGDGAIYVPDDLVDAYKSATNWSIMSDFIKPMSEYKGWTLEDD